MKQYQQWVKSLQQSVLCLAFIADSSNTCSNITSSLSVTWWKKYLRILSEISKQQKESEGGKKDFVDTVGYVFVKKHKENLLKITFHNIEKHTTAGYRTNSPSVDFWGCILKTKCNSQLLHNLKRGISTLH